MEMANQEIQDSLQVLETGGLLLFRADHGWCIGCDATNDTAVGHLRQLLQEPDCLLPVLLAEEREVLQYVAAADLSVFDFVAEQQRPTAIVFEQGIGFADGLAAKNGTVLILLTQWPFCRHLVKRFRSPIVAVPCELEKTRLLLQGTDSTRPFSCYVANAPASPGSLHGALQIVYWKNGMPIVQDYR